jgi:hypothetical protein
MSIMMRALILAAGALLLVISGLVQGVWSQRWGAPVEFTEATARLQELPLDVGEWKGRTLELDADAMAKTEAAGYLARVYQHRTKGEVRIILLCGRPGPVSLHTPEVCFPSSGLLMTAEPERCNVAPKTGRDAQFLAGRFRRSAETSQSLRVFWSFRDENGWRVPDNPRVALARAGILYKLYLMRDMEKADQNVKDDPTRDFLRVFLPQLDKYLSPASSAASSAE